MSKILIIGDIMGRPGRAGLAQVLPMWKEQYQPDVVIANVENLTHGKGITENTIKELNELSIDAYTSGNHVFDTGPRAEECFEQFHNIIRPANYLGDYPGQGFYRFAKNNQQYLLINLGGTVFFEHQFRGEIGNPFFAFDAIIKQEAQKDDIIIVDLHAEATSEKNAFGWYADGRATIVYGTHTHIPTADTKILPKGTAYQTDIGMTGAKDSVLGALPENALKPFLEQGKFRLDLPDSGPVVVSGLLAEVVNAKVQKLQRLQQEVEM